MKILKGKQQGDFQELRNVQVFKRGQCRTTGTGTGAGYELVQASCSWFELSRVKLHRKLPEGKRKLPRKITVNVGRNTRGNRVRFE